MTIKSIDVTIHIYKVFTKIYNLLLELNYVYRFLKRFVAELFKLLSRVF